ncbi:MAG: hypothetical protein D6822_01470 [Cyanobacteria bacterium J149]|nr:MAG: hypothetical protein D6822_01470 [Cyanobacteria bacterium J149]
MIKDAYKPTLGSTPAIMENAIASGIRAKPTTAPAKISALTLKNHSLFRVVEPGTEILNMRYEVLVVVEPPFFFY